MRKQLVFITGMPGVGKTHIGELLAYKLNLGFIDLDNLIEKENGLTINQIISSSGIQGFRTQECSALLKLETLNNHIVSLGGGCLLTQQNRSFVLDKNHTSVYLHHRNLKSLCYQLIDDPYCARPPHSLFNRPYFYKIYQKHQQVLDDYVISKTTNHHRLKSGYNHHKSYQISAKKTVNSSNIADDFLKTQHSNFNQIINDLYILVEEIYHQRKIDYEKCTIIYDLSFQSRDITCENLSKIIKAQFQSTNS